MMADVERFHFRLVLLGSHGTGKTSILNKFLFKKFETKYKPTVEDLFSKDFDLGSIEIKVDFLDTSGSMQFPAMRRLSITTGSAFLIVYAVDDETSYEVLKMCIAEIQEIRPDYQEIPIVFAGNKCDIPRERRKVFKEDVSNYVHYEILHLRAKVIECSCRDDINIENIFRAYLSLAKVSLSSAVSASKIKNRPSAQTLVIPGDEYTDECNNLQDISRKSSMKVVLGVRKSCDASIISPRKNTFVSGGGLGGVTTNEIPSLEIPASRKESVSSSTNQDELDLETAIQSKLDARQRTKPRSRSLIWRPNRKSRSATETSDCKVS